MGRNVWVFSFAKKFMIGFYFWYRITEELLKCGWMNMQSIYTRGGLITETSTPVMYQNKKPSGKNFTVSHSSGLWKKWLLICQSSTLLWSPHHLQVARFVGSLCWLGFSIYFWLLYIKQKLIMIQIAIPYSWLLLMTQKICLILQYTRKSFTAIKTTLWTFDRVLILFAHQD